MTRYSVLKQFFVDVYDLIEQCGTLEDAYHEAERRHIEKTGERVYKNYESFKSSKSFHWGKGQHIPG